MAAEEDHHYGGEKGGHGGVTAMMSRYGVVEHGGSDEVETSWGFENVLDILPSYSSEYEVIKNSEKDDRTQAHNQEVSKLKINFYCIISVWASTTLVYTWSEVNITII